MTTLSEGILGTEANFNNPMTESQTLTNGRYANWSLTFLGGMAIVGVIGCVALTILALYEMVAMNALIGFGGALTLHYFVVIEEVFTHKEAIEQWRTSYQDIKLQSAVDKSEWNSDLIGWNADKVEIERLKEKYRIYERLNGSLDQMEADEDGSGCTTPTVVGSNNSTPLTSTPVKSQYFLRGESK